MNIFRLCAFAACAIACCFAPPACDNDADHQQAIQLTSGGDPSKGKAAMRTYGCASCHTTPAFSGAAALVGPPLDHIGSRNYIGGVAQNTPQNMIEWVQNPRAIDPKTAMPNLHVSESDARDIASFLYTLR